MDAKEVGTDPAAGSHIQTIAMSSFYSSLKYTGYSPYADDPYYNPGQCGYDTKPFAYHVSHCVFLPVTAILFVQPCRALHHRSILP